MRSRGSQWRYRGPQGFPGISGIDRHTILQIRAISMIKSLFHHLPGGEGRKLGKECGERQVSIGRLCIRNDDFSSN